MTTKTFIGNCIKEKTDAAYYNHLVKLLNESKLPEHEKDTLINIYTKASDLVTDKEKALQNICQSLNIPFEKFKKGIEDDKKSKDTKKKEIVIPVSLYVNEKKKVIAEQVFDGVKTQFCIYTSLGEHEAIEYSYDIEDNVKYVPNSGEEIWKRAIRLPSMPEEYGTDQELEDDLKKFITTWLDIPEDVLQFAIWNIKRSWVYERFHTLNYLRALGDTGQGKSRFLDTLGALHYKPIATSGASTAAPIFRIIDKWHGTLIMDEADFQKSDEAQDIIKIINQGYEKGKHIMRCDTENKNKVNFFDPFCPKILATRRTFEDKAVESRCITQVMTGTNRRDIPWNLNDKFLHDAQILRNKLLMWRFRNYFKIDANANADLGIGELEPRVQQIVGSFISLFGHDTAQFERFKCFIKDYQEDLIEERKNSFEGLIVQGIHDLIEQGQVHISAKDIIENQQILGHNGQLIHPRKLNSVLKSLGFKKSPSFRVENGIKRCISLENEHLLGLFKRYGVTVVTVIKGISQNLKKDVFEESGGLHTKRYNRNNVTGTMENSEQEVLDFTENSITIVMRIVEKITKNEPLFPVETLIKEVKKEHPKMEEIEIDKAIDHLKWKDMYLFEPKPGFLHKVGG